MKEQTRGRQTKGRIINNTRVVNRKKLPFRTILTTVSVIAVIASLTVGLYRFFTAEMLDVKHYTIEGNNHLSDSDVLGLIKINNGKNILSLDGETLMGALTFSPWVKTSFIRKELPDTIHIKIIEKEPIALYNDGRETFLIDDSGIKLDRTIGGEIPKNLPVISIATADRHTYEEAVKLAVVLGRNKTLVGRNIEISGTRPEDIAIRINDVPILIGLGNYEDKLQSYLSLKDEIAAIKTTIEYIDVRFAHRLIVKPASKETS